MKKIFALILALSLVFTLAACGSDSDGETVTQTEAETETVADITETVSETEAETEAATPDSVKEESTTAESKPATEADVASETDEKEDKLPSTKAEILAEYTKIMNQAKKEKPGFTKVEYQELPEEGRVVTDGEGAVNAALGVAANFMTDKEKAEKDPFVAEKGGDMNEFPIRNCPSGCLLTDTDFLKSAKCEELSNGNRKITLVLKSETNPEPVISGTNKTQSKTGSILSPVSKAEIDETLNGSVVSAVGKDIQYQLTYHDCVVELTYNPETGRIVQFHQITRTSIKGSAKVLGVFHLAVENTELIDYLTISKFVY